MCSSTKSALTILFAAGLTALALPADACPAAAKTAKASSSCGSSASMTAQTAQSATQDIVDTAVAAGSFETLVAAVKAAGLVDTLKGEGPFTVFAPTDAAFAALPDGALEGLLSDPAALRSVLTYHVVPGSLTAEDLQDRRAAKTVQGQRVSIGSGQGLTIDGARVIKADIATSNGVIHVIDSVILPSQRAGM